MRGMVALHVSVGALVLHFDATDRGSFGQRSLLADLADGFWIVTNSTGHQLDTMIQWKSYDQWYQCLGKLFISIYSSISQIHDERIDVWLVFFKCIHQCNLERPHLSSSKMMVPIGNPPQMASRYKVRPQSHVQVGLVSPHISYHISCYVMSYPP